MNDGAGLGTYFYCTSTSASTMQVGVELFGAGGGSPINSASGTALSVGAGATVIFGTGNAAGIVEDSLLAGGNFNEGSAIILSTSKSLICSAFLADALNGPPALMTDLTIVKKVKQKGE